MADEVEAFEMRDLDTGQQQVIFDLESGEGVSLDLYLWCIRARPISAAAFVTTPQGKIQQQPPLPPSQQNEVFTFSLPGQVPDFYASAGSAPAPPAPASAGTAVVLDGQPLTAVLAGAADVRDPKDTYTVYIILVCRSHHSPEKPAVWTVFRRYRAFKTLAEALKRRNVSVAVPLPSKLWLLGTLDADFLRRRRQGLEAWLSSLLTTTAAATPQLFSFPEVQAFFSEHADDLPKGIDVAAYRAALADLEAEAVAAAEAVPHAPAPAAPAPAPVTYHYTHVSLGGAAAAPAVGAAPGPPPRAEAAARAGGEGPAKHTPVPPPPRSTAPAAPPAAAVPAVAGPATSAPGAGARPLPAATRSSSRPSAAAPRIGLDSFELLKVIGKGSFGKVLLVRKKDGGSLYAMKVLSKQNIVKRKQVEHTITERRVLSYTRHPFIVALHYAFQTRDKLFLVVDLALGGELFFHLGRLGRFAQDMTCFYTAELVLAIGHLHKLGVVYRDLKPGACSQG